MRSELNPLRILYVEDNPDIREMVTELIDSTERHIVACADAEAAWQQLQQHSFDVLVTDVRLPGLSGTELARRWLQADASRWVILFSGYDFGSEVARLGAHVRAILKEDVEMLERTLVEIGQHVQLCAGRQA